MLFVYRMDIGNMMTFDMSFTLRCVRDLMIAIEHITNIAYVKQVLIISGGEYLDPDARVCSYPAGTDTNPFFLFNKAAYEACRPPVAIFENEDSDIDVHVIYKECTDLVPSYNTVIKRTQLAQQFYELGQEQVKISERLVHEQHLQHQGWMAVLANFEDISRNLNARYELYKTTYQEYMAERETYLESLKNFEEITVTLQRIPVFPELVKSMKKIPGLREKSVELDIAEELEEIGNREMNLLHWIIKQDIYLDKLYECCLHGLLKYDENFFTQICLNIEDAIRHSNDQSVKKLSGLSDRLSGLESLLKQTKELVKDQMELAQSFVNNKNRATNLKEPSILPDLCETHLQHMPILLKNYNLQCDITRRAYNAKKELCVNLHTHLQFVMKAEKRLCDVDSELVYSVRDLTNLRRHLELLQQIIVAPVTYLTAVAEVVRRRSFSQSYLLWSSELACHLLTLHNDELAKRKDFQAIFEGHFLRTLFPGMDDLPPTFATEAPSIFDSKLPKVLEDDVDRLKNELPDLADHLSIPDNTSVMNFFMLYSVKDDDKKNVDEKLMQAVKDVGLASNLDRNLLKAIECDKEEPLGSSNIVSGLAHLKDLDKGCESETDTEEFEKVSQSPFELNYEKTGGSTISTTADHTIATATLSATTTISPSPMQSSANVQDAAIGTEDNLEITRSEHEKVKTQCIKMKLLVDQTINQLKTELSDFKTEIINEKSLIEQHHVTLNNSWDNLLAERENHEREVIQRLTVDHELEISDFRKIAQSKNEEIKSLKESNAKYEMQLKSIIDENLELKKRLDEAYKVNAMEAEAYEKKLEMGQVEHEKNLKETVDRLKCEHRDEVEGIRSRFKLMTMERSPSESSLEKIEGSLLNEGLLMQMRENLETEKEIAINEAVAKENDRWQQRHNEAIEILEFKFEQEKDNFICGLTKRFNEDREKQVEVLREQIKNLQLECVKNKSIIQQLTESDSDNSGNGNSELMGRIEVLEKEKEMMEEEMEKLRKKRSFDVSESICEEISDTSLSEVKQKHRESPFKKTTKISIDSCKDGDFVLIVWEPMYQNFKILQCGYSLYFVHFDSLKQLQLTIHTGKPNKLYCVGEVIDREFCKARKPVNRFNVPKGTRFFRVRVKPVAGIELFQQLGIPSAKTKPTRQLSSSHYSDIFVTGNDSTSNSLPSSPTREHSFNWEQPTTSVSLIANALESSLPTIHQLAIPEEKGVDDIVTDCLVEKGKEVTENFTNEDNDNRNIDRSQVCVIS